MQTELQNCRHTAAHRPPKHIEAAPLPPARAAHRPPKHIEAAPLRRRGAGVGPRGVARVCQRHVAVRAHTARVLLWHSRMHIRTARARTVRRCRTADVVPPETSRWPAPLPARDMRNKCSRRHIPACARTHHASQARDAAGSERGFHVTWGAMRVRPSPRTMPARTPEPITYITSHHITSHHITSHHITPHHIGPPQHAPDDRANMNVAG